MVEIFLCLARERSFDVSAGALRLLKAKLEPHLDNGRYVRNLLERTIIKKAINLYKIKDSENVKTITAEDISFPPETVKKGVAGFVK